MMALTGIVKFEVFGSPLEIHGTPSGQNTSASGL
jgi:hypothetical protein